MAPPPRARPPPMNAPASSIAWGVALAIFSSIPWLFLDHSVGLGGWYGVPVRSMPVGRGNRAEVEHGQQREDERLDRADEQVEELPHGGGGPQDVGREQRDQGNHDRAGEDVAEKTEGQRDRPGDLFDQVDREQPPVRLRQVPVVTAEALLAYAGDMHPDDDEQRERVRQVHVRCRRRQDLGVMNRRQYGQPVGDQQEQEDRDREGYDERRRTDAHRALDLLLHSVGHRFEDQLCAFRDARRDAAAHQQPETDDDRSGDDRGHDRVDVEVQAADRDREVVADLDGADGDRVADHRFNCRYVATADPPSMSIWKIARPTKTPRPSGRSSSAQPSASTVTTPRRPSTDRVNRAFLLPASLFAYVTTARCTIQLLPAPSASPKHTNRPITTWPSRPVTTRLATPKNDPMISERRRFATAARGVVAIGTACTADVSARFG